MTVADILNMGKEINLYFPEGLGDSDETNQELAARTDTFNLDEALAEQ